jgi:hypothetical protein
MKHAKKSEKNINALDGAALSDVVNAFLWKEGHRDTLQASDKMAKHWFRDCLILEEEDFSEELPCLRYYSELTGVPVIEVIREALKDWRECCYPGRVEKIEKERGIPSTFDVLPSSEIPKLEEAPLNWNPLPPREDLPN